MSAYELFYIVGIINIDIISYVIDFKLERELEKLLDKLTLKVSRRIDSLGDFSGFNPDVELYLKFNGTGIFRGRIKTSDKKEYYTLEVYSCAEILNRIIVQKIYENTSPEEIFTDLINIYTDLIPHTGVSGATITNLIANDYIGTICKNLNNVLGWTIYTDSEKNIYFEPRGAEENAVIIRRQSASSNAILGEWKKDYNEMCNYICITGSTNSISTTESFTGDGTTSIYYLTNVPIDVQILINSVEQNPNTYSIYPQTTKITFDNAPANAVSIVINYSYIIPLYISRRDETSISSYGEFTKVFFHNWLTTRSDLITYCNAYLTAYKNPLLSNNIMMNASYITIFNPGEQVRIIDDIESYNNYYIINKIKLEYLKGIIELNVGSYIPVFISFQSSINDRIKELEKNLSKAIAYANSFGYLSTITPQMTLKGNNERSPNISIISEITLKDNNERLPNILIAYTNEVTPQDTGTFLIGTARVDFSEAL